MGLLWWLLQIATAPIKWVVRVVEDISWDRWEENQMVSVLTAGTSSLLKWTVEWLRDWIDSLWED